LLYVPVTIAGPIVRAGFIDAPVAGLLTIVFQST
jgi:hypothetical protein